MKNLFIYYTRTKSRHSGVGTHQRQERREEGKNKGGKRRKKKRIEAQRLKSRTPTRAIDALIGGEEQTGKKGREQRKKQGAGFQLSYPGPFGRLRPVGIIRGAYSCNPPQPTGGIL